MYNRAIPITTTTLVSLMLHVAAFAVLVYLSERVLTEQAVGEGLDIELVSSTWVDDAHETESADSKHAENPETDQQLSAEIQRHSRTEAPADEARYIDVITTTESDAAIYTEQESIDHQLDEAEANDDTVVTAYEYDEAEAVIVRSTDASQRRHTILELLHASISQHKVYPYLARRQRREGISTVAFILHPDGRVEQAQLVSSSKTSSLDRAALSAVEDIAPFQAAKQYLDREEVFQVDVVFSLL